MLQVSLNSFIWINKTKTKTKTAYQCTTTVPLPIHGSATCTDGRDIGSNCTTSCSLGYRLSEGSTTRTCTLSGNSTYWSGRANCTAIMCGTTIPSPLNGGVTCTRGRYYGSICTYSCSPGYGLHGGSTTRTCVLSGDEAHWTGQPATCEDIPCPAVIMAPTNGKVSCSRGRVLGSNCSYSCSDGYQLTAGSTARICTMSGNETYWIGQTPSCTALQCPSPISINDNNNGDVICSRGRDVGSICIFSCPSGHWLSGGSSERTCEASGEEAYWSGQDPNCTAIQCSETVPAPSNGHVMCSRGRDVDSTCTYSCTTGYLLSYGSVTRTCTASGSDAYWSGRASSCTAIRCAAILPRPYNGNVMCTDSREVGSVCTYSCSAGYRLIDGSTSRTCSLSGNEAHWCGEAPSCTAIKCPASIESPSNGNVICSDGYDIGSTCTYSCSSKYRLVEGSTTRKCTLSGNEAYWDGRASSCTIVRCPATVMPPSNGNVMCTGGSDVGSTCIYSCSSGYRLTGGSTTRTCQQSEDQASWSGMAPFCSSDAFQCAPSVFPPVNGMVFCTNGREVGSTCTYGCRTRFELSGGSSVMVCVDSGNEAIWNGSAPTCSMMRCQSAITDPAHGHVTCTSGRDVGSYCTYSCSSGYRVNGCSSCSKTRRCILSGNSAIWTGSATNCSIARCASLPSVHLHGDVACTSDTDIGSQCFYSCSSGYQLIGGTSTRTCRMYGNLVGWSGSSPRCVSIRCSCQLTPPDNGSMICTKNSDVGSICIFSCSSGYFMEGNPSVTCTVEENSAAWNGTVPSCVGIRSIN